MNAVSLHINDFIYKHADMRYSKALKLWEFIDKHLNFHILFYYYTYTSQRISKQYYFISIKYFTICKQILNINDQVSGLRRGLNGLLAGFYFAWSCGFDLHVG